ncbi:MAG: hypothetical protein KQ78_02244 [Candidatus Izimaplasma bacterium HR2]|nr:MAG: hypothetical protein KQ78_02244 [Candidatus Izimaplasma bacterium HR2]
MEKRTRKIKKFSGRGEILHYTDENIIDYVSAFVDNDLRSYQIDFLKSLSKENIPLKINKDHFKNEEELFEV